MDRVLSSQDQIVNVGQSRDIIIVGAYRLQREEGYKNPRQSQRD
jgi:hypothetical protein